MQLSSSHLIKKANRLSKMLRSGSIGSKGLDQIKKYQSSIGGYWQDPEFRNAAAELQIGLFRKNLKNTEDVAGSWLPAHIAYGAKDNSAKLRTANLLGVPSSNINLMAAPNTHFNQELGKLKHLTAKKPSDIPEWLSGAREDEGKNGILDSLFRKFTSKTWAKGIADERVQYHYDPNKNFTLIPGKANPVTRHEIGHRAAHALAFKNPEKLNIRTTKAYRTLNNAAPEINDLINKLPAKYQKVFADELQGHVLAARAGRGGQRLREATAVSGKYKLNPLFSKNRKITSKLNEYAKHPDMQKNPEVLSAVEHLARNYGLPIR